MLTNLQISNFLILVKTQTKHDTLNLHKHNTVQI